MPPAELKPAPPIKSFESWIWSAACSIRGADEVPKDNNFMLPLIVSEGLYNVFADGVKNNCLKSGEVLATITGLAAKED